MFVNLVQFCLSIENTGQCFNYRSLPSIQFFFVFFPVLFVGENSPKLFNSFKQITKFVETNEIMTAMSTFHSSFYWKQSQFLGCVYCLGKFQFVAICNDNNFWSLSFTIEKMFDFQLNSSNIEQLTGVKQQSVV